MTNPSDRRRGSRPLRSAAHEALLTSAAVAGVLCMVMAAAAIMFDLRPLVFRSGSMSPAIHTGALGVARTTPATDLVTGDVVSVTNAAGTRITHRIHSITLSNGVATLVLWGDANRVVDAEPYVVTEADKVLLSVNGLGYAVAWLSSTAAVFLGGLIAGALLVIAFGRRSGALRHAAPRRALAADEPAPVPTSDDPAVAPRRPPTGIATVVAVVAVACGSLATAAVDTQAAWADTPAQAVTGAFATTTTPVPTNFRCEDGLLSSTRLRWTSTTGMLYRITFSPSGGGAPQVVNLGAGSSSYTLDSMPTGTATLQAVKAYPSTQWASTATRGVDYQRGLLGGMSCG